MYPRVRALVLAEAGPDIGYGHVARCAAIAGALETIGVDSSLAVRGRVPAEILGDVVHQAIDWFDAEVLQCLLTKIDLAVVDSYEASSEVRARIAANVPLVVWLDDNGRVAYPAGIIVNPSLAAAESHYGTSPVDEFLLGPRYLALRAAFADSVRRRVREKIQRVLVVFGGTDLRGAARSVTNGLGGAWPSWELDVVTSARSATEMREAMLAADVAVSAAGQTLYELASTGLPSVAVAVVANQEGQARALAQAGAVLNAGSWDDCGSVERILDSVSRLEPMSTREKMSRAGQDVVDGSGASRLARALVLHVIDARIEIAPARREDETPLLELANDPGVRRSSLRVDQIGAKEHNLWFANQLEDPNALLLLAREKNKLVGYVRFAIEGSAAIVSIALAEDYRGRGLGTRLLNRAVRLLQDVFPRVECVEARVKCDNPRSHALFECAGFVSSGTSPDSGAMIFVRSL